MPPVQQSWVEVDGLGVMTKLPPLIVAVELSSVVRVQLAAGVVPVLNSSLLALPPALVTKV